MARRKPGDVGIAFAGRTYRLRIGMEGMLRLEERLSTPDREVSFFEFWQRLERQQRIHDIRLVIWAAMLADHPEATVEETNALIDEIGGPLVALALIKPLSQQVQPDPKDLEALGATPGANPRGARGRAGTGRRLNGKRAGSG